MQRQPGDDLQFHPLFTGGQVAGIAILHRHLVRDEDALDVEVEARAERRRTERISVRRIRFIGGASGVRRTVPVRAGQLRVRRDLHVGLAHERRRVLDRRRRTRRLAAEAEQRHGLDGDVFRSAVRNARRHVHWLVRHHDAVVGDRIHPQSVREQDRLLELVVLLLQPEVDLVGGALAEAVGAQRIAQRAKRGQPGEQFRQRDARILRSHERLLRADGVIGDGRESVAQRRRRIRSGVLRKAGQRGIDAFEERRLVLVLLRVEHRRRQLVARAARAAEVLNRRSPLALVHARRDVADLADRAAEQRIVAGRVDRRVFRVWIGRWWCREITASRRLSLARRGTPSATAGCTGPSSSPARSAGTAEAAEPAAGRLIQLLHLPLPQPLLHLLRELRRIRRRGEGLVTERRRHLVMLATTRPRRRQRDHDVGADGANHADVVAQDLVVPPLLQRFLRAEREAEVHGAREVLLGAVPAVRREQLLGAQHADRVEQLRADLVLAAVAARGRHQRDAHPLPARVERQHRVVLVVGMRRRVHEGADGRQLAQRQAETDLPLRVRERLDEELRRTLLRAGAHREDGGRERQRGQQTRGVSTLHRQ